MYKNNENKLKIAINTVDTCLIEEQIQSMIQEELESKNKTSF